MIERYKRAHGEIKIEGSDENTPQVCPEAVLFPGNRWLDEYNMKWGILHVLV